MRCASSFDVDAIGIALEDPLGPLDDVDPTVGPRQIRVVTHEDRAAVHRTDQADVDVAERVALSTLWRVRRKMGLGIVLEPAGAAAHRHQVLESIAAIDVHAIGDRPESVGGIQVPIARDRMRAPPEPLVRVLELHFSQVVEIPAFAVLDVAEHTLAHQVEHHHLGPPVIHVLHHHAMFLRAFGGLDELPAFVDRHGGRNLGGRMLAVRHGGHAHGHVPPPRRGREHEIQVFLLAHSLEIALPADVPARPGLTRLLGPLLHTRHLVLDDVAQGTEANAVDPQEIPAM